MSGHHPSQLNPPRTLAELPPLEPPVDSWPQVARRLAAERAKPRTAATRWMALAAAASLVLALGLISQLSTRVDEQDQQLQAWMAYSQELEAELDTLRRSRQTLRGHQAIVMDELEEQIAALDRVISTDTGNLSAEDRRQLWQHRAVLLNDLVTVQAGWYSEAGPHGVPPVITLNPSAPPAARTASYEL